MNGILALCAFAGGFTLAQLWKLVEGALHRKKHPEMAHFKTAVAYIFRSGGMPSAHSADMTALTIYLGCAEGFTSSIFAVAVACSFIVMYDAIHVRYAVGEQGRALNRLLNKAGDRSLPIVEGHTPLQMVVGATLGAIVGVVVYLLLG